MHYFSTRQVATLLGISVARLTKATWLGRVQSPSKSPPGNYLWPVATLSMPAGCCCTGPFGMRRGGGSES